MPVVYGPSHSSLIFPVNWTQFPFIIFKSETLKVISTYFLLFSTSSFVSSNLPFFPIILFIVNPLQTLFQNLLKHQCLTFQILSNDLSFLSLFQTYTLTHLKYSSTKSKKKKKKNHNDTSTHFRYDHDWSNMSRSSRYESPICPDCQHTR